MGVSSERSEGCCCRHGVKMCKTFYEKWESLGFIIIYALVWADWSGREMMSKK